MQQDRNGMPSEDGAYTPRLGTGMEESVLAEKRGIATREGLEGLGARVTRLRKERGITQQELAQRLGVSQPIISKYESGELRLHGELIIKLTELLDVSADELLGLESREPARLPKDRRLVRRLHAIDRLSKRDREALSRTIDAFLAKAQAE
jgi:transcriptional regulator with XRE-family HTH domain